MRTKVLHLIGGRFDGAEMLFYGNVPLSMAIEALDRRGHSGQTYRREYAYTRKSMRHHGLYTEYHFQSVGERIVDSVTK